MFLEISKGFLKSCLNFLWFLKIKKMQPPHTVKIKSVVTIVVRIVRLFASSAIQRGKKIIIFKFSVNRHTLH